jgi:hypothetical protein
MNFLLTPLSINRAISLVYLEDLNCMDSIKEDCFPPHPKENSPTSNSDMNNLWISKLLLINKIIDSSSFSILCFFLSRFKLKQT